MSVIEKKKRELNIKNIESAAMALEIKIEEMMEEIERKKAALKKQNEILEQEIAKFKKEFK